VLCLRLHMISVPVNISALTHYPGSVSRKKPEAGPAFPERLSEVRKNRSMTQQALADRVGIHVVQLRRYESGASQPTLDVIRNLAVALSVSADLLLFGKEERGPDDELRLQFEAVTRFDAEEKKAVRSVLDGLILRHEARKLSAAEARG
jgi:transcriptional regulator with XRE-family HTH domain